MVNFHNITAIASCTVTGGFLAALVAGCADDNKAVNQHISPYVKIAPVWYEVRDNPSPENVFNGISN